MQPVRTALVGIGGIGGYHRSIISTIEDYEFVAAAEKYPERQEAGVTALQEQGIPLYEDIWEMLDSVEVDAVTIAVPHHYHAEYTLGCLDRGLHVLCEKPVTVLIQDAYAVVEAAKRNNRLSGVDFQYTSYPHSYKLKELIMSGELGELREIVGVMSWKRLDSYYSRGHWTGKQYVEGRACFDGVLMNQAVHLINTALQMGTREDDHASPVSMEAELYTVHDNIEVEDLACLRADLGEARLFFYATTCNMKEGEPERTTLEIIGTKGRATWDDKKAVVNIDGRDEIVFDDPRDRADMHLNLIRCIRGEDKRLHAPADRGLKATLTINGAYTSAGAIHRIGWEAVEDIKAFIDEASDSRRMFSEMGVDWARAGSVVDMTGYREFTGLGE
ncbi:MAG: Gfo/Idh/MocA family oxidoreductase [Armatimonadetes bacterium]|nr:Gfo/Idh/MocA family oxidoreductase [Armatimonadota bacterium]